MEALTLKILSYLVIVKKYYLIKSQGQVLLAKAEVTINCPIYYKGDPLSLKIVHLT